MKKLNVEVLKKYKITKLIFAELAICLAILIFNISYGRVINYPSETIYFNCILFLFYFILSIILIRNIIESTKKATVAEEQEKRYKEQKKHLEEMEEANQKLKAFRHDYKNILISMSIYIKKRDIDGLETYFNENILPTQNVLSSDIDKLAQLDNLIDLPLRSIISSKLNTALLQNIRVGIEIPKSISIPVLKSLDLARIMGIILDNAIESALETEFPEISLVVKNEDGLYKICVMNRKKPYHTPDLNLICDNGYSTKGEGRGLGLHTVDTIIKEYDKVTTRIDLKTNFFLYYIFIEL